MNKKIEPSREEMRRIVSQRMQDEELEDLLLETVTGGYKPPSWVKCTNPAVSRDIFVQHYNSEVCENYKSNVERLIAMCAMCAFLDLG